MSAWATIGQLVVFFAALAAIVYAVTHLADAACHWAAGWKARAETYRSDLAHAQSSAIEWRERARVHEVQRAVWESTREECVALRAELAVKQRRLRGLLRQARAWKGIAIGYGYSRAEWLREVSEWKAKRYARKVQRVAAAKWDTEMCSVCVSFHHKPREGCCDGPPEHPCHGPRCAPKEATT